MFRVTSNRRVLETMSLLCDTYLDLLSKRPYSAVSVSDICTHANVARKTFYRNFDSKDDVLDYIISTKVTDLVDLVNAEDDPFSSFRTFCEYWRNNARLLSILNRNNKFELLTSTLERYMDLFRSQLYMIEHTPNMDLLNIYYFRAVAAVEISLLETWSQRNFKDSIPDLYHVFVAVLRNERL